MNIWVKSTTDSRITGKSNVPETHGSAGGYNVMLAWCMFHNPVHYRIGMLDVKNKAKKKKKRADLHSD